jgi:hypothetical protein
MKKQKRYPEVFVEADFLTTRDDIVLQVVKIPNNTYKVLLNHPVLGRTVEIFEMDPKDNTLCLRSVFPSEMQKEDEMEVVKDYYNNFLLDGQQTYLEYYNEQVGYFLLSRNLGIYNLEDDK